LIASLSMIDEDSDQTACTGPDDRPPILVIGGTGHVGAALCQFLSARGHRVIAANRSQEFSFDDPGIGCLRFDVLDPPETDRLPAARTVVICPWVDQHSVSRPWIDGLVRRLAEAGTRSLIYLSSMRVYGGEPEGLLVESAPVAPTNAYGSAHLLNEVTLSEGARELGVDVAILRMANLVGPDPFFGLRTKIAFAHEFLEMALFDRLIVLRSAPSTPRNLLPGSLFHHDIEPLLDRQTTEGRVEIFNVGSGSTSTMVGLAREIAMIAERYHGGAVAIEHPEESTPQPWFHLDTTRIRSLAGPGVDDLAAELSLILRNVLISRGPATVNGRQT